MFVHLSKFIITYILIIFSFFAASCSSPQPSVEKTTPPEKVRVDLMREGIRVSWKPVPGAQYYTVFWGQEKGEYKGLVNVGESSIVLTGLNKGELYVIAVTSWNKVGESYYSEEQIAVYDDDPANANFYLTKANELMSKGALKEANAYFSLAIVLAPNNPAVYKDRAAFFEKTSRLDLARKDRETAEKLYKDAKITLGPAERAGSY